MRPSFFRVCAAGALVVGLLSHPAPAQTTDPAPRPAEKVKSMGQPFRFKPYVAGEYAWNRDLDTSGAYAVAGVYKDVLFPPVAGALGLSLEGYGGGTGGQTDGGARFFITSKVLFLGLGWDWNFRENVNDAIIAFTPYLRIAPGTREGRPKMHRKAQFFATKRALRATVDMPATVDGLRRHLDVDSKGTADPASLLAQGTPLGPAGPVLTRLETDPPPGAEDAIYFLTVGSKNQDPRGAILDGETSYVVAGPWTIAYYRGFLFLMVNTTWIEEQAQFDELISVEETGARKLGRLIRKVL